MMTMTKTNEKPLPNINNLESEKDLIVKYGMRKGTLLEKSVSVSREKMLEWEEPLRKKFWYYTTYPDLFLEEVLIPTDSTFKLLFTQRIFLREMMRFNTVHITAARGFSKTFLSV